MPATIGPMIIAHRGASYDAPENTLAAVNLAWQQGADAVEVDVQFSRDQQIVVIHDDDTNRIGGVRRLVREQTWAELRTLDAGSWKGPSWKDERFPRLDDVIATVPAGKQLFVEVKCGPESVPALEAICRRAPAPQSIIPIGFCAVTMALIKRTLPDLSVALVADFAHTTPAEEAVRYCDQLVETATAARLDALDLDGWGPLNADFIQRIKRANLKVYVWTVDDPARAAALIDAGVDGITTNRPGWLRAQLPGFLPKTPLERKPRKLFS